jgi:phage terminase large subunit
MEDLKARDYDAYLTVWEGHCKQTLDGAIYANEVRAATIEERFTRVPYEQSKPVHTFWDLGRADKTAIWFAQIVGFEFRLIDYYENQGHALAHYLKHLQSKPYVYGDTWLPHDADNELLASERTIAQQARAAGYKVRITPKSSIVDGINAARTVFSSCWFDNDKCADGLQCLRNYRYEVDPDTQQYSTKPLHDWASHGADAFRYFAVALREPKKPKKPKSDDQHHMGSHGWMA